MWNMIFAASSLMLTSQEIPNIQYIETVGARSVAINQYRTASAQCEENVIEISWNVWGSGSGSVFVKIDENSVDLLKVQPDVAEFFNEGGAQRVYIVCQADKDFEVTLFRALYLEEVIDHSHLTFSIDRDLNITFAGMPQKVEADELEVWYHDWNSPDIGN